MLKDKFTRHCRVLYLSRDTPTILQLPSLLTIEYFTRGEVCIGEDPVVTVDACIHLVTPTGVIC